MEKTHILFPVRNTLLRSLVLVFWTPEGWMLAGGRCDVYRVGSPEEMAHPVSTGLQAS